MTVTARTIVLAARPDGKPRPADFRMDSAVLPEPRPGHVLLQTLWLSLDPYMRGMMSDGPSYGAATELGHALPCDAVARVLVLQDPGFKPGDFVLVDDVWRDHMVRDAADLRKLDPAVAPVQTALGVMAMPGLTAYTGLKHVGRPKARARLS